MLNPSQQLYCKLREELAQTNFFETNPLSLIRRIALYGTIHLLAYVGMLCWSDTPLRWVAVVGLTITSLQFYYLSHDAGHYSLSRKKWLNIALGHIGDTFIGGASFRYWQYKHNFHHRYCNEEKTDPDAQTFFFKFYPDDVVARPKWLSWTVRYQPIVFWFFATLHNFEFQRLSWVYTWQHPKRCRVEQVLIPLHYLVYLLIPGFIIGWPAILVNYFIIHAIAGVILAKVFIVNHIGMPTLPANHKLSFIEQQVITSRNVKIPRWLDDYFGGLQYQIEHHLFPWVSISRYREGSPIVRDFCEKHAIPYVEEDLFASIQGVQRHLSRMSQIQD